MTLSSNAVIIIIYHRCIWNQKILCYMLLGQVWLTSLFDSYQLTTPKLQKFTVIINHLLWVEYLFPWFLCEHNAAWIINFADDTEITTVNMNGSKKSKICKYMQIHLEYLLRFYNITNKNVIINKWTTVQKSWQKHNMMYIYQRHRLYIKYYMSCHHI